jgi:hypothetical protein
VSSTPQHDHFSNLHERRLLDVHGAASYLGLSVWTIRDYVARGILRAIQLPASEGREGEPPRSKPLRRVLIDRGDLDRLVDASRGDQLRDRMVTGSR